MGYQITSQELIARVRARTADRDGSVWNAAEVLNRCDQALERIWTDVRLAGRDHDLDVTTVAVSTLVDLGNRVYEWEPGPHIAQVRQIEGVGTGPIPQPIPQSELRNKDWARILAGGALTWHRGPGGKIRFVGGITHLTTLNVYFLRRWPPLHYGTAASGSTTTVGFAGTSTGRILRQTDAYVGHKIQFLGTPTSAITDLVVRVTSYNRITNVATFTPALPAAVVADEQYSILVPVDAEHSDMVAIAATMSLLASGGNDDYMMSLGPLYAEAEERFRASLSARDQDSPRTLHYTDR